MEIYKRIKKFGKYSLLFWKIPKNYYFFIFLYLKRKILKFSLKPNEERIISHFCAYYVSYIAVFLFLNNFFS